MTFISFESVPDHRLITETRSREIWERVQAFPRGDGELSVFVQAWWRGSLRWARNRVTLAGDQRDITVSIRRGLHTGSASASTNQLDDRSLQAALRAAERKLVYNTGFMVRDFDGIARTPPRLPFPDATVWSDATYNVTHAERSALAQVLSERAETNGLLAAGFIDMRVGERCMFGVKEDEGQAVVQRTDNISGTGASRTARTIDGIYLRHIEAQCSMTVRHPKGTGSGWAGLSGYDWAAIDAKRLSERALEKCQASLNPVRIEPGRFTVILEPQAVAELVRPMIEELQSRGRAENKPTAFNLSMPTRETAGMSKLGLKVIDERVSISHDPMDSGMGVVPGVGLESITWIDRGVLTAMGYKRGMNPESYSLGMLNQNLPNLERLAYRMTGGTATIEEMIATTKRGILVTRFSGAQMVHSQSLLSTGVTRDGLWLIEGGKIKSAISNMRWTDSPLFMLNQIEQLGVPVPVFNPSHYGLAPVVVPPIKARDFAFTATIDAI